MSLQDNVSLINRQVRFAVVGLGNIGSRHLAVLEIDEDVPGKVRFATKARILMRSNGSLLRVIQS